MSQFFPGAINTTIRGRDIIFQHVEGNPYHNHVYHCPCGRESCRGCRGYESDRTMPVQNRYREIFEGDVILRKEVWSKDAKVAVRKLSADNTSSRSREARVKVTRKYHTAEIIGFGDRIFTVVSFELEDKEDREAIRMLWKIVYEASSAQRSPRFVQMLGLMMTDMPTVIMHDELVNGMDFCKRYHTNQIVFDYLVYTHEVAIQALRADTTLAIPIPFHRGDWTFNIKTQSWQYDPATFSISQPEPKFYHRMPTPLHLDTQPQLNSNEIVAYFRQRFGDSLYLFASLGGTLTGKLLCLKELPHNYLTFGTVVNLRKSSFLAHFPSTPSPEWFFENYSRGIKANYSRKVPSRVDFNFCKTTGPHMMDLFFSMRLPEKDRNRFRAAYLCQFNNGFGSMQSFRSRSMFIDEVRFSIVGDFPHTPAPEVYLFVPPLSVISVNEMWCIHYPLPESLFYWSVDPEGKESIPKEDWKQYGIPYLQVMMRIGSFWFPEEYECVMDHLRKNNYDLDGKQYAHDHEYPELIRGDPHDRRIIAHVQTPPLQSTAPSTLAHNPADIEQSGHSTKVHIPAAFNDKEQLPGTSQVTEEPVTQAHPQPRQRRTFLGRLFHRLLGRLRGKQKATVS
ncbi:hypothetical protein PM082_012634 [Marasmius tenuissimus]|nr:hypothetical protein PM082_012634 [Marasmius tenuissimus]